MKFDWLLISHWAWLWAWLATCNASPTPEAPPTDNHAPPIGLQATPSPLSSLLHDYWLWKLQASPEFATTIGINDNTAGKLDSFSEEHYLKLKEDCEDFLLEANEINESSLTDNDRLNLQLLKFDLSTFIDNFKFLKYFNPISKINGVQLSFPRLINVQMTLDTYDDFQKLLSRYGEFPRQANEIMDLMQGTVDRNMTLSNWTQTSVLEAFDKLDVDVEASIFYEPFLSLPKTVSDDQKRTLRQVARERIEQDVLPAIREIRSFMLTTYLPNTRPEVGASSMPGGSEYYQACLHYHTSTLLTPSQIHQIGLTEVERIEEQIVETAQKIGLRSTSIQDIFQELREDPSQQFLSKEEVLDVYNKLIHQEIYPKMSRLVPVVPDANVTVVGNDNPNAIFASYRRSNMDGSRGATFVLGTANIDILYRYEMTAVSLHEAVPGHHLHYSYVKSIPDMPMFRKYPNFRYSTQVPARFPTNTVFSEGWGLYAEFLGEELGLYKDPHQRIGRLSFELLRAVRLVVDTGLHALQWSREKAVDYMNQNTHMDSYNVKKEVDRYLTWPGQACAYKIGEIKLKELRQQAQNALAELFKLQEYHDVILRCQGPINILQKCVNNFITKTIHEAELAEEADENEEDESKLDDVIDDDYDVTSGAQSASSTIFHVVVYLLFGLWARKRIYILFT